MSDQPATTEKKILIKKKKPIVSEPAENITSEIIETPKVRKPRAKKEEKEQDFTNTCVICAEKFNKSNHLPVKCQYCEFTACRDCCETYVLSENDPHCMDNNCKKQWTRQYLAQVFSKVFCATTLKNHRENVLLEKNKSMLPTVIPVIEATNARAKLALKIKELQRQESELRKEISNIEQDCMRISRSINNFYNSNNTQFDNTYSNEKKEDTVERNVFVRPCPANDCRGFLSSKWKCGICEIWVCPDCGDIKGKDHNAEHTCKPENKESMDLMKKDTRPCPECGTRIFKIEGCNQMFCTNCNTGFCWRTGKVTTGEMHNPHYFEWMRRTGGNPGTGVGGGCGQITPNQITRLVNNRMAILEEIMFTKFYVNKYHLTPIANGEKSRLQATLTYDNRLIGGAPMTMANITRVNGSFADYNKYWIKQDKELFLFTINSVIRNVGHTRFEMQGRYRVDDNSTREIKQLQVSFLRNEIDEPQFKSRIHQITKREEKNREIMDVVNLLCDTVMAILLRFCDTIMKDVPEIRLIHLKEDINTNIYYNPNKMQELLSMDNKQISDFIDGSILKEIIAIVDYANDCFKLISGAYQCVVIKYDYKLNRIIQKSSKKNTEENKNNIIYTTRNGRQHYMTNNRYEQETDVETDKYDPTLPNYYDWLMKK